MQNSTNVVTVPSAGRPSKYQLRFCEDVLAWGAEGWSLTEMAAEIGVARSNFYEWMTAHPEFQDAITRAREKSQAWWEKQGRLGMTADKFNATVWAKNMNCRFPDDWRDVVRQEQTGANGGPVETVNRVIKINVIGVTPGDV